MKAFKKQTKYPVLLVIGGLAYLVVEIFYRGHSHWTMFLLGGLCFILCGQVNEQFEWDMPMWKQQGICAIMITTMEFVFGCVFNLLLGMHIWDYSHMPFNILGQVCLPFTFAWFFLSAVAIILDDYLRYWIYGEEKPHYVWW